LYTDIEKLIPQRPPMVMIDGYEKLSETSGRAVKHFTGQDYGCSDGVVSQGIFIECIAQTVAAHHGYKQLGSSGESPAMGMLVAIDHFEFFQSVPENSTIKIHIEKTDEIGPFHLIKGTVFLLDKKAARGQIKIFHPPQDTEHP
jgi:predicted hotdog family 3-hydroxylacyl-ACP dehydratase